MVQEACRFSPNQPENYHTTPQYTEFTNLQPFNQPRCSPSCWFIHTLYWFPE